MLRERGGGVKMLIEAFKDSVFFTTTDCIFCQIKA